MRILLLGGTTEASAMAKALAARGMDAVFSYAGRTQSPVTQPLPTRIGGFGGIAGLREFLSARAITHIIDATHPFAAQMSLNAHTACAFDNIPLTRFERPAWVARRGDNWTHVPRTEKLVDALPVAPARVFLAIGKQQIGLFATKPQHHYLLRLVDPPETSLPLPDTSVVISRGPFDLAGDSALLQVHRITHVVCKNAGGSGARAKLDAARALGLPVIMADRPRVPGNQVLGSVPEVLAWLSHVADRGV